MSTKQWCSLCALVLVAQIFSLSSLPFELVEPWDKAFHLLAYAALTLMLWIATDGRRPRTIVAVVILLGVLDETRQSFIPTRTADILDFLADGVGAAVTGALMYWNQQGARKCAESSARSRAGT